MSGAAAARSSRRPCNAPGAQGRRVDNGGAAHRAPARAAEASER
jgi:hypothetical protein